MALLATVPIMATHLFTREMAGGNLTVEPIPAQSYFNESTARNLLHGHIGLMSLSWIGAFPIYLVLDFACSNLAYPAQIVFLGLNAIGIIFGLAYNSKTPDLYPGNVHPEFSWLSTGIAVFVFALGIMRSFVRSKPSEVSMNDEQARLISTSEVRPSFGKSHPYKDLEASAHLPAAGEDDCASSSETSSDTLYDVPLLGRRTSTQRRYSQPVSWTTRWGHVVLSDRALRVLDTTSTALNTTLLILALITFCTGIVTTAGIFHENKIFNGLAHFIKGGVFFTYGLITFARWVGCFSHLGWAWNLKPAYARNWRSSITMEGVECALILLYGTSNVFLEHLSAPGEAWTAQDLEHVAISLLFFGGGLCGVMIETKVFRPTSDSENNESADRNAANVKLKPGYSLNPIPALIISVLGTVLAGHHQATTEATMMHKWVGNFLAGGAIARFMTYILILISPPASVSPSRPPSEIVTSFCLCGGGVMLMASNRDTIMAMISNGLNATLVATINIGCTAALLAWGMGLFALYQWASRREGRESSRY